MKRLPQVDVTNRHGAGQQLPVWPKAAARSTTHQDRQRDRAELHGVPIEADPFNILILNYTMKCPLACDYCCYTCGPKRPETMDLDLALSLVDQAAELGVFGECGFTGGEPLVFFDDIVKITTRMAAKNLPFSMISACDWATDDAEVSRRIDTLADRGMSVFTVSHDPSHEKWVPREHVNRVVDRVLERGIRAVICGSFYDDQTDLAKMFPEYAEHPSISFVNRVVLPTVGRSAKKAITTDMYPNADLSGGDTCYKRVYHDVTVFWDGEVYPCCSVYNRETPKISYGNVYRTPLAEIWDRISGSLFLRMIKRDGLPTLVALLRERAPDLAHLLPADGSTIGPCHLCHVLMTDPDISKRVLEIFDREERERVHALLEAVRTTRGEQAALGLIRRALNHEQEGVDVGA